MITDNKNKQQNLNHRKITIFAIIVCMVIFLICACGEQHAHIYDDGVIPLPPHVVQQGQKLTHVKNVRSKKPKQLKKMHIAILIAGIVMHIVTGTVQAVSITTK